MLVKEVTEMRSPQEIVTAIAYTIKEGKKGDAYAIAELSKKTQIHYVTMNDYLNLIEFVQRNIPSIEKVDQKGKARIIIKEELKIGISETERMILNMFDRGAFSESAAIPAKPFGNEDVLSALEHGMIREAGTKIFLTTDGIVKAAGYAEKRVERATDIKRNYSKYDEPEETRNG